METSDTNSVLDEASFKKEIVDANPDFNEHKNGYNSQSQFRESDAGDGTVREDHILTGSKFYFCVISLVLCMFLVALDQMITAAVLTNISNHFHEFNKMTWITAAFLMPMGCFAQVWGRLSINFGRKWTMVSGIILFEIGSLISGISTSMNMFIGGRAIQGVGGSCVQGLTMIIATEITTIDKKPILFGVLSLTFVVASVLGPIIGGIFGTYVTWRWCFYINLCCGGIIFPFFIFSYKTKPPKGTFIDHIKTIDFLDSILMIVSLVLILIAISFGQTDSWNSAKVICCFSIGGVTLAGFLLYNFKFSKYPVIPKDIIMKPTIIISFIGFTMNYSCLLVVMQFLSIYFENIAGHNSFHTGLSLIPAAVACSGAGLASGIFIQKVRHIKEICVIAVIIQPVSVGLMQLFKIKENIGYTIGFQALLGIATGLNFQGPLLSALLNAPKTPGSSILTTALFNFGRSTGAALFSEIAGAIYTETLRSNIKKIAPLIQEKTQNIDSIILNTSLLSKLGKHDSDLIKEQMLKAIKNVFWLSLAIALSSLVVTVAMSNKKIPKKNEVDA